MAYPAFDLAGKVALVTGGNSGIGLGMAEALAQAGAAIRIWGTNAQKNASALDKLRGHGAKALALVCDVGDEAAVERSFAETVTALGKVDACFANAGVSGRADVKSFLEMSTEEWKRVTRVNLDGAFFTLRAAARHMVQGGHGGSLVVTSSLAAISGQARGEHYAAAKGGVIAMLRALAVEFARHGIRANAILPGWIETAMTEKTLNGDKFVEKVLPRVPLRRAGRLRRHRGLPRERGERIPHRRHVCHRRRLLALLERTARRWTGANSHRTSNGCSGCARFPSA